jgi:hypothetical protein
MSGEFHRRCAHKCCCKSISMLLKRLQALIILIHTFEIALRRCRGQPPIALRARSPGCC